MSYELWCTTLQVLPSRRILFGENEWNVLNITVEYLWIMQAFKCQAAYGRCVWNRFVLKGGYIFKLIHRNHLAQDVPVKKSCYHPESFRVPEPLSSGPKTLDSLVLHHTKSPEWSNRDSCCRSCLSAHWFIARLLSLPCVNTAHCPRLADTRGSEQSAQRLIESEAEWALFVYLQVPFPEGFYFFKKRYL